jgi:hypothetical protein
MSKPWYTKPHGVLDPMKHERLIANREFYARDAGIPQELLWRPLPALTDGEKDWLAKFKRHRSEGYCGLLLTGKSPEIDPLTRIGAMAGFLSRNFVRARVFSLLDAMAAAANNEMIQATCLLIPDFVPHKMADKKQMPGFRVQQLTSLLTERWSESNLQTVLYAPSMDAIRTEYGTYVHDLIKNHYVNVEVA